MVDVSEEGVRAPSSHDLDGFGIKAIEVKGSGTTSTKRVAGDEAFGDALAFQVESSDSFAEGSRDLF